ncbi:hypothetical protein LSTR_LSTR005736 [Laodelphax striatellus]|uniref:Uncharacterized protein n=1 Tax=Laodelphax striatellus TaxID=195883 RepID=A0A482XIN5_LAOST|nr:hypothetical protein LSTR_LSTR005736 [Laodelphax striatellus]
MEHNSLIDIFETCILEKSPVCSIDSVGRFLKKLVSKSELKSTEKIRNIFRKINALFLNAKKRKEMSYSSQIKFLKFCFNVLSISDMTDFLTEGLSAKKIDEINKKMYSKSDCNKLFNLIEDVDFDEVDHASSSSHNIVNEEIFHDGDSAMSEIFEKPASIIVDEDNINFEDQYFEKINDSKSNDITPIVETYQRRDQEKLQVMTSKVPISSQNSGMMVKIEVTDLRDIRNVRDSDRWRKVAKKAIFISKNEEDPKFKKVNECLKLAIADLVKKNDVTKITRKNNIQ